MDKVVKECGGQDRALWDTVVEGVGSGFGGSVCYISASACQKVCQPFLVIVGEVCVEYFLCEYVFWDCVEGFIYVNCC